MKVYHGFIDADHNRQVIVTEEGEVRALPLRLDLDNHSPTGFAWGYGGSGPAQLALAILADAFAKPNHKLTAGRRALLLHQAFKWEVIAGLPQEKSWAMAEDYVLEMAEYLELSRANRLRVVE